MKGVKLIDVDLSEAREEITGTCELCFGSRLCDNPVLTFENQNGEHVKIDGYGWDWGDYFEVRIDNYLDFSDWIANHEIDWDKFKSFNFWDLSELVLEYIEEGDGNGE